MSIKSGDSTLPSPVSNEILESSGNNDDSLRWISKIQNRDEGDGNNIGSIYEQYDLLHDDGNCSNSREGLNGNASNKRIYTQIRCTDGKQNKIQNTKKEKTRSSDCQRGRERMSSIVISNLSQFHRLSDITIEESINGLKHLGSTQQPDRKQEHDIFSSKVKNFGREEEKKRDEEENRRWNITVFDSKSGFYLSRRCFSSVMTQFLAPVVLSILFVVGAVILFSSASSKGTMSFDRQGWMDESNSTTRPSISNSPTPSSILSNSPSISKTSGQTFASTRPSTSNLPTPSSFMSNTPSINKSSTPSLLPSSAVIAVNTVVKIELVGTCQYTDMMGYAIIKALESTYHDSNDVAIFVEIVSYSEVCPSELNGMKHLGRPTKRVRIFATIVQRIIGSEKNGTYLKDREQILEIAKSNKDVIERDVSYSIGKKVTFRIQSVVEEPSALSSPLPALHRSETNSPAPSTTKSTPIVDAKSNIPTIDVTPLEDLGAPFQLSSKIPNFTTMKRSLNPTIHSATPTMQQSNIPILIIEPSIKVSYNPSNYAPSHNPPPVPSFKPSYHTSLQPASSLMPTSLPSFQPTVVANAPASCMDYPHGWVDADGINCEYYAHPGYCNKFGRKFAKSGKTANQACCVCGGGTIGGAKKYSQP